MRRYSKIFSKTVFSGLEKKRHGLVGGECESARGRDRRASRDRTVERRRRRAPLYLDVSGPPPYKVAPRAKPTPVALVQPLPIFHVPLASSPTSDHTAETRAPGCNSRGSCTLLPRVNHWEARSDSDRRDSLRFAAPSSASFTFFDTPKSEDDEWSREIKNPPPICNEKEYV